MNERIRELKQQATIEHPIGHGIVKYEFSPELFAELIVRECIGVVDDAERGGSNEVWDNAVKFIRRDLQEHFGVEE